jgi:hypothetical protein
MAEPTLRERITWFEQEYGWAFLVDDVPEEQLDFPHPDFDDFVFAHRQGIHQCYQCLPTGKQPGAGPFKLESRWTYLLELLGGAGMVVFAVVLANLLRHGPDSWSVSTVLGVVLVTLVLVFFALAGSLVLWRAIRIAFAATRSVGGVISAVWLEVFQVEGEDGPPSDGRIKVSHTVFPVPPQIAAGLTVGAPVIVTVSGGNGYSEQAKKLGAGSVWEKRQVLRLEVGTSPDATPIVDLEAAVIGWRAWRSGSRPE